MQTKENQRYIYYRSLNKRIPVTDEEFTSFYNEISVFRRKQQRHGLCCCPKKSWLSCDSDCNECTYRLYEKTLSLDYTVLDSDGNKTSWANNLPDNSPLIADIVTDGMEMQKVLARLSELMPDVA